MVDGLVELVCLKGWDILALRGREYPPLEKNFC